MTDRRWEAGWTARVSGVQFRLVPGKKEPGDLRLEVFTEGSWQPVHMAMAALMTDFFVENEEHLRQFRPHWRQSGHDYFIAFLEDAVARGWEAASATLRDQQQALARPAPVSPSWCRASHPQESVACTRVPGHDGPHKWNDTFIWPQVAA